MTWFAFGRTWKEGEETPGSGQDGKALGVAAAISAEGDAEGKWSGTMEAGPGPKRQTGTKRDRRF
jgi:hypothetical protein